MGFQYLPLSEANIVRHHTEGWCVSRPLVYSETVRMTVCPSDGSSLALHSFYLLTNINHQVRSSTYQLFWRPLLTNTDILWIFLLKYLEVNLSSIANPAQKRNCFFSTKSKRTAVFSQENVPYPQCHDSNSSI